MNCGVKVGRATQDERKAKKKKKKRLQLEYR